MNLRTPVITDDDRRWINDEQSADGYFSEIWAEARESTKAIVADRVTQEERANMPAVVRVVKYILRHV